MPAFRLRIPQALKTNATNALQRLEYNFDPRVGLRRIKRYQWEMKELLQYGALLAVSWALDGLLLRRRGMWRVREGDPLVLRGSSEGARRAGELAVEEEHAEGGEHAVYKAYQLTSISGPQLAAFSLTVMAQPLFFKLFLVVAYTLALLVPFTSQFFLPATPIFSWLLLFYSSQFIPKAYRPHIWVSVLPTLESVLYGANISDILTRYTNPFLDIMAWIPYGIVHFAGPFVVAACLFIFSPPGAVKFWGSAFGYLNLFGVMIQILVPCAPPCPCPLPLSARRANSDETTGYELRNGLVPANYDMRGSPGGLARIDAIFHSSGYTKTFTGAPVPFGAFPSLHAGCSTMEALFLSHFFPQGRVFYWAYVFWLYWSTMVRLSSLLPPPS